MKTHFRKGLAAILCIAMMVGLIPGVGTVAVSAATDSAIDGENSGYDDNGFCFGYEFNSDGAWVKKDDSSCIHTDGCSGYQPANLTTDTYDIDGDGNKDSVYEIGNAGQLYWFEGLVNGTLTDGTVHSPNANAVLTADITVNSNLLYSLNSDGTVPDGITVRSWTPIGGSSVQYHGQFDGQKYTISGLYFNDSNTDYVGLFGYIGPSDNVCSVLNVGVVDSYFKGNDYVGGVCGRNLGGAIEKVTIENCYNSGEVIATAFVASAGGVCGYNSGTITNCYNSGKISANGKNARVGGVCGANYGGGTITNCYSSGEVGATGALSLVGGVCGYNSGTITNCYYDSDIFSGAAVESNDATVGDNVLGKTTDEFKSGEVAYLLQSGQTEVDGNIPQVWGQTVGTDDYPVLGGSKVYQNVTYEGCENAPGENTTSSYANEDKVAYAEHTFNESSNGFCVYCDEAYQPANLTTGKYDIDDDGTYDEVYEIGNAGQLYWFAQQVNGGSTSLNAVLTADITVNENVLNEDGTLNTELTNPRKWTPIGNDSRSYNGIFDGQNHTVSGLYFNDESANYVGLFGYVLGGGVVSNMGVVDSYISSNKSLAYVGGVCGYNAESVITNCYNTGIVSATGDNARVGGVCGLNSLGLVTNCFNSGTVSATGENIAVGGVCGYNRSLYENYSTLQYCYNIGTISGSGDYVGSVCGYNYNSTIEYCYYLENTSASGVGSDDGTTTSTESKTEDEFKSGKVAYLLNDEATDGTQVWYQNLDNGKTPDDYPVFDGGTVYYGYLCNTTEIIYSNYPLSQNMNQNHDFNNGFCIYCGAYEPAKDSDSDGVYEISNAGQLYWFAALVNGDKTHAEFDAQNKAANAVLTKDITVNEKVLNEDGILNTDLANPRAWMPISNNSANHYTGTFDGNGYTVSGLYFNDTNSTTCIHVGLFGYVDGGSISNVGVVDSYINAYGEVGGVCGYISGGTIENCYNTGEVSASGSGAYVGGVCGYISGGTIENCYNTGEVSATGSGVYVGGVCGHINKGEITNCYYLEGCNADDTTFTNTDGTSKTVAQFSTGEVAYLLQGDHTTQVWGQNIDNGETVQAYPVLGGANVYRNDVYASCTDNLIESSYSNIEKEPVYVGHNDADGDGKCDYCGNFMDGSLAKLAFASLSLKGNIGVNFYMDLPTKVIDNSNAYMQFTLPNGSTEKILVSNVEKNTTITEGKIYYVFSCEVAAKEMTADIKAQIISGDATSESFTYRVKNYADYIMSHTEDYSEDVISLVQAMLNYGAASQEYFEYNTDALANSSLTDEQKQLPDTQASDLSAYAASYTKDKSYAGSTSYYGSSLVLKSNTEIKHYFTYDSANTNPDNFVCKDGNYYQISESGDYLYVRIDNIPAHKLGDNLTLSLYEDDVKVGDISYSPLSYVYSVLSAYPTDDGIHDALRNNVKALYQYYLSADAYLNIQQSAA